MIILSDYQKAELASLIYQVICEIRMLSRKPVGDDAIKAINNYADSIHNLPMILVSSAAVDENHLLACISSAGDYYYLAAKKILMDNQERATTNIG